MARERKVFSPSSSNNSEAGDESDDPLDLIERTPTVPGSARSRSAFASTSTSPTRTSRSVHSQAYIGAKRRKLSDGSSSSSISYAEDQTRTPTPPRRALGVISSSDAEEATVVGARASPVKSRSSRVIVSDASEDEEHVRRKEAVSALDSQASRAGHDHEPQMEDGGMPSGSGPLGDDDNDQDGRAINVNDPDSPRAAKDAKTPQTLDQPTSQAWVDGAPQVNAASIKMGQATEHGDASIADADLAQTEIRQGVPEVDTRQTDIAAKVLGSILSDEERASTPAPVHSVNDGANGMTVTTSAAAAMTDVAVMDEAPNERLDGSQNGARDTARAKATETAVPFGDMDESNAAAEPADNAFVKIQPADEDLSVSAAFDPPLIAGKSSSHDSSAPPPHTLVQPNLAEIASSSAAPSPAPSTSTSAPTPRAAPTPSAPVEEIYGYTEAGRPILGYTSTGRPILGKATDARHASASSAPSTSTCGTVSQGQGQVSGLSAKEREKQRKAKVAAAAKEKEAAKAHASLEKERAKDAGAEAQLLEGLEEKEAREAERRAMKEAEKAEKERVKEMENVMTRMEKDKEKEKEGKSKGKGGKKGKVEDLKGKARSNSVSTSSAKASSPDIASSTASTPEPIKPSSSFKAKSNRGRGSSVIQPPPEDEDEGDDDEVYCSCGLLGREDGNDDLVGCDACDHWFHAGCVGLKSEDLERIDSFICQSCEKITNQRTTFQKFCARAECGIMFAGRQSKFCSSACGIKHAQTLLATVPAKNLPELSASLADFPSPPPEIRIIDHAAYPDVDDTPSNLERSIPNVDARKSHRTTEHVMAALRAQLEAVQAQLAITAKRQQLVQGLMERCDALPSINSTTNANKDGDDSRSKEKKKGKPRTKPVGASSDDRPCGWSCVMLWDEQEVEGWDGQVPALPDAVLQPAASAAGDDAGTAVTGVGGAERAREAMGDWDWCDRPRKRCERHSGWQKTAPILLDREAEELHTRLTLLETQLAESKEAQEVEARGRTARPDHGRAGSRPQWPAKSEENSS